MGWKTQSKRHSNARKYGKAGGMYAKPKKRFKTTLSSEEFKDKYGYEGTALDIANESSFEEKTKFKESDYDELKFIVTSGHGYLKVPKELFFDVSPKISPFSFHSQKYYYLEEDVDYHEFKKEFKKKKGFEFDLDKIKFVEVEKSIYPNTAHTFDDIKENKPEKYLTKGGKFIHIAQAEEKVGGKIYEGYEVHHKDENANNNKISNLAVLKKDFHKNIHSKKKA